MLFSCVRLRDRQNPMENQRFIVIFRVLTARCQVLERKNLRSKSPWVPTTRRLPPGGPGQGPGAGARGRGPGPAPAAKGRGTGPEAEAWPGFKRDRDLDPGAGAEAEARGHGAQARSNTLTNTKRHYSTLFQTFTTLEDTTRH